MEKIFLEFLNQIAALAENSQNYNFLVCRFASFDRSSELVASLVSAAFIKDILVKPLSEHRTEIDVVERNS